MSKTINATTAVANEETLLTPRFYRTDIAALEKVDLEPVRYEWNQLMDEFESDGNVDHFIRDASFKDEIQELDPELYREFIDFLTSSVTSEYSGCVLYENIANEVEHPDLKRVMRYMQRDEARHAGFINRSLKDFGQAVDLGFLKREKKETFFRPKFIWYATYLSEKIGYARYITIYRHLQRHPEKRFHPMFRWFEQWCQDEFRHGEVFALIMRAQPGLLSGLNRLWIRFFLLAVYATMYVRDHTRPGLFEAFGMDPTEYDYQVFDITSEISRQVFPIVLDTDSEKFRALLGQMNDAKVAYDEAMARGGLFGRLAAGWHGLSMGVTFARLYVQPVISNELQAQVRVAPSW